MRERSCRDPEWIIDLALVGDGAWFAANLYEGLVDVPQLLIDARPRRSPGIFAPGSPVRYFALTGPVAVLPTGISLALRWHRGHRSAVATSITVFGTALALTGYLIRTVNMPLLLDDEELVAAETSRLKTRWHVLNAARLVSLGIGISAIKSTRSRHFKPSL